MNIIYNKLERIEKDKTLGSVSSYSRLFFPQYESSLAQGGWISKLSVLFLMDAIYCPS